MSSRCPACGATYDDGASFCTRDGTRLLPAPPHPRPPRASALTDTVRAPELGRLEGRTLGSRYRIESKAGEGGMSFVYRATDLHDGARLAIKILTPSLARDATALARLRREANIGARIAHPNVCHIIRLAETDGLVYIVMPYVEGELLCDRTHRLGQIALPEAIRLVAEIAAGLNAAHALHVVHRDLKPENVMICPMPDGGERAVVMDFGLAKERRLGREAARLTATGIVIGTPEFMSPEQVRGRPLDARADVYSLGVLTYEMLTGMLPFSGSSQQEIMMARIRGKPIPLRQRRPDLSFPPEVDRVIARCLAADPAWRYRSAPAFADALSEAASGRATVSGLWDRIMGRA